MASHIGRRKFLATLGSAAAWPLAAQAQQQERMRRIGVLIQVAEGDPQARTEVAAFLRSLQELGWSEGRNLRGSIHAGAEAMCQSHSQVRGGTSRTGPRSRPGFGRHGRGGVARGERHRAPS
jgi:hypothetical protein